MPLAQLDPADLESEILSRNQIFESCALESFSFRLPCLVVASHFYYKHVPALPYEISLHEHKHWEIARISSGRLRYAIPGTDRTLVPKPDQWAIIPPRTPHSWTLVHAPLVINSWQVKIEPEDESGERILTHIKHALEQAGFMLPVLPSENEVDENMWAFANRNDPAPVAGAIFSGFARIFISLLLSRLGAWDVIPRDNLTSFVTAPSVSLAERVKQFLEANLQNTVSLENLEAHFNFSSRHLNRLFKAQNGDSIGHYLRRRRMELSRRWLATTSRSIKDIALSLGYQNSSQFCRYFLRQYGMTPTEFRQKFSADATEFVEYSTSSGHLNKVSDPFQH